MLKLYIALQQFLAAGLALCMRVLQRRRRGARDEMPFSLALTVKLVFISQEHRQELERYGTPNPTGADIIPFPNSRTPTPRPAASGRPPWRWSLGLVMVTVFLVTLVLTRPFPIMSTSIEYTTGVGEHRTIPLPGSSSVVMNTQSRLVVRFSLHARVIDLIEGEALFSVAPDPRRPFTVRARHTVVEAVGTQFSVYLGNSGTKIAVTQGRVKVFENVKQTPIILNPSGLVWTDTELFNFLPPPESHPVSAGQEAEVPLAGSADGEFEVDARWVAPEVLERHIAWVNGQLAFEGETLGEVVAQFNRYNWLQLRLADPGLAPLRVGGIFKSTHLDEFTSVLTHLWGIRATLVTDPLSHEQVVELARTPPGVP